MVRKSVQSRHSTRSGLRRSLLRRRGPVPIEDDSWDNTLAIPRAQIEAPHRRTGRYRWIIAAAGLGGIAILVTLTVAPTPGFVSSGPDSPANSSTEDGAQPAGPGMAALHSMPPSPSDTPSDGERPTGAAPPFSADSGSSGSGAGSGGSSGPPPTTAGATLPPPAVVVEAETGVLGGSASLISDGSASGGAYVGGIGDWGDGNGPGSLVLTSVNLPSTGTWRVTIYFIDTGPKGPRHATVIVSGASPQTVQFAGSPTCCGYRTLDLALSGGSHTITISNPDDVGPSVDRITFTLLPVV